MRHCYVEMLICLYRWPMLIGHVLAKGNTYATLWSEDVRLPKGTATIAGPESKYSFIRSVELSTLKELVRRNSRWGMTRLIHSW